MPILELCQRQRERVIKRTWTPISPELLTAQIGGTYYKKTFEKVPIVINKLITIFDPIPFGFFFDKPPKEQWVALTDLGGIQIDPVQSALLQAAVPDLRLTGVALVNQPGTISDQQKALLAASGQSIPIPTLRIIPITISVGKTVTPLNKTSLFVRRVTVLAASANVGTIWIVSTSGGVAGQGFPLVAGAAKDFGFPTLTDKLIDLSTIFVVGTDAADSVNIAAEA